MTNSTFMIEELSKDIVFQLINERNMSIKEAFKALYTSDTYQRLIDIRTGLFSQSTAYVYEYLDNELNTGKMA